MISRNNLHISEIDLSSWVKIKFLGKQKLFVRSFLSTVFEIFCLKQPNNKYFSSMAASGAPMTVYSAARLDSDRIGTDSTVTPEQSVLHYTQPFTLDFSAVPFHLVAAADGLAVHPSQHQMVYPQSSSTPAPVPMSKVAADRLTHTPPTKYVCILLTDEVIFQNLFR